MDNQQREYRQSICVCGGKPVEVRWKLREGNDEGSGKEKISEGLESVGAGILKHRPCELSTGDACSPHHSGEGEL